MNTLLCEEKEDGLFLVKLNRPDKLNALNTEMIGELDLLLDRLEKSGIKGLIITGEGTKAFAAGADISEMERMTCDEAKDFSLRGNRVFRRIEQLPVPVIAAVNGYALGGGCELAMSCDIILCSVNAVFGQPETGLGVCPGFGGTVRLLRRIGMQAAKELIYSGRYIRAGEAAACGLVLKQTEKEDLLPEAEKLMRRFMKNSRKAISAAKKSMDLGSGMETDRATELEAECFSECFLHEDRRILMERFLSQSGKGKK